MTLIANFRQRVENNLANADVQVDGIRPTDIVVHDDRFYARVVSHGALGLGESYVDGWWDCSELAGFFCKLLKARLDQRFSLNWATLITYLRARVANRQEKSKASENVHRHYDLGNDLYRNMLGQSMLYSSANWEHASCLNGAGEAKLDFVCRRLKLRPR